MSRATRCQPTAAFRQLLFAYLLLMSPVLLHDAMGNAGKPAYNDCPIPPAVLEVTATPIYADRAGSMIDDIGLHENQERIQPLRSFDRALSSMVDYQGGRADTETKLACASSMLRTWAHANALTVQPTSFAAIRERQRFTLGIDVVAFKLRARAGTIDPEVIDWLKALNVSIMDDFERRHTVDNLYVWSAVNAGSVALVTADERAKAYQDRAWQAALAQIDSRGYLKSELRRQTKALLYHQYYLSALFFLSEIRLALGLPLLAPEMEALTRLSNTVEDSLCDATEISKAAGGFKMELPPPNQFIIGSVFGKKTLDSRWTRCGKLTETKYDETMGGRLDRTYQLLLAEIAARTHVPPSGRK